MKKTMTAFSVMVALGAGLMLAPFAHASWLPDSLSGGPAKASKEHKEKQDKLSADVKENLRKKSRVEAQSVYLTRRLIALDNQARRTLIRPPDYSKVTTNPRNNPKK